MLLYVKSGASAHMINSSTNFDHSISYTGQDQVVMGKDYFLNILVVGNSHITKNLILSNVLVVPHITKNLILISRLTHESPVDVILSNTIFVIQNHST